MDKDKYIKETVKRIKCSSSRKKEIKKQLETDIDMRLEQGEAFEQIIAEMGSAKEIADGFNENLSDTEKRRYRGGKTFKIVLSLAIIFALIIAGLYMR